MGYIRHAATIASYPSLVDAAFGGHWAEERAKADTDLAALRESMPEKWRALIVGPVEAITNGEAWIAFLPDGSKEGWEDSITGAGYRRQFQDLFGGLTVHWGDDEPTTTWEPEETDA